MFYLCANRIVTFVPEMKGKPGKISIWQYPGAETPLASRSSFRAQVRVANSLVLSGQGVKGFDWFKRGYLNQTVDDMHASYVIRGYSCFIVEYCDNDCYQRHILCPQN